MPTVPLPEQPSLAQLRKKARELHRAVRAGDDAALAHVAEHDPDADVDAGSFALNRAQLVVARHHGFPSWARLVRQLQAVERYTRVPDDVARRDDPADEFLRLACLTYGDDDPGRRADARALLRASPDLARTSIHAAAATADATLVEDLLSRDSSLARREGGPFGWEPLLYLAAARHDPHVGLDAVTRTARALLAAGADPNAGYLWHGLPSPFTVLTLTFGGGELGPVRQPHHPHANALARVLLDAGADPNDGQALYNRMFERDDDHLVLLFEHGLGTGDGGPWRRRLPDLVDDPGTLVREQLGWAVTHGMHERIRLLAAHGVDVASPLRNGRTPVELAGAVGDEDVVELLRSLGVTARHVDPVDAWVAAALAADRARVRAVEDRHPGVGSRARDAHPALVLRAVVAGRADAVRLLVDAGFDVNARGRGDLPIDEPWETALHHAAGAGDVAAVRLLLSLGADPNARDARFDATPLGWAEYFDQTETASLLDGATLQGPGDASP